MIKIVLYLFSMQGSTLMPACWPEIGWNQLGKLFLNITCPTDILPAATKQQSNH